MATPVVFVIYTSHDTHLGFSSSLARGEEGGVDGVRDTLAGRQTQRQPAVNY